MIFSENRCTLFRIMLYKAVPDRNFMAKPVQNAARFSLSSLSDAARRLAGAMASAALALMLSGAPALAEPPPAQAAPVQPAPVQAAPTQAKPAQAGPKPGAA